MCGSDMSTTRVTVPSAATEGSGRCSDRRPTTSPTPARRRANSPPHQDRSHRGSPPPGSPAPTSTGRRPTRRCHRRPGRCRSGCRDAVTGPATVDPDVQLTVEIGDVLGAEHLAHGGHRRGQPGDQRRRTAGVVDRSPPPPSGRRSNGPMTAFVGVSSVGGAVPPLPGQRHDQVARVVPGEPPRVRQRRRHRRRFRRGSRTHSGRPRPPQSARQRQSIPRRSRTSIIMASLISS